MLLNLKKKSDPAQGDTGGIAMKKKGRRKGWGNGGGCGCRRWGRRPPRVIWLPKGALGRWLEVACVRRRALAPYIGEARRFRGGRG